MDKSWLNNNSLKKFTESNDILRVECTFKEFINSPFFTEFSKSIKNNGWVFGTGSDRMRLAYEKEEFDSWMLVYLYLDGSRRPSASTISDNIQSIRLTLNLDGPSSSTYLEIWSSELAVNLKRRLTRSGYILFNLSEEMVQALKKNYEEYYEDYFPDLNKPYENPEK